MMMINVPDNLWKIKRLKKITSVVFKWILCV